jgi:hypothetical protein
MLIIAHETSARDTHSQESIIVFLDRYFSAWSNGDMDAFKDCFHPEAAIVLLDRANSTHASLSLVAFIRTQEDAHQRAPVKMREVPVDKQIIGSGDLGQATVRWKLFKGYQTVTGVDLFTLVFTSGEWKILHLTVRND